MPIPEAQLETWSHQGAMQGSSATYQTIKSALESPEARYRDKSYEVHLQGSYCNDTNIFGESDVDVVMRVDSVFHHDLERLPEAEKEAFASAHSNATYTWQNFKDDVQPQLVDAFGQDVTSGKKAITIAARGSRRPADVLVATQFRRYHRFRSLDDQKYELGIYFFNGAGQKITNFPKQHSKNCTVKHQGTGQYFKPVVRIFKNLRCRLVEEGVLASGIAPSYFIEGLLYNVPDNLFGSSYQDSVVNALNWLLPADRSELVCANYQFYLLRGDPNVTWSTAHCDAFLKATVDLWEGW